MLKIFIFSGLFILAFNSNNILADECKEWTFEEGKKVVFQINTCAYTSGKSGYYELKNLLSNNVKVCWKIEFNNGESRTWCRDINSGEAARSSCYDCNPKSSGVSAVTLTKFERK